MEVTQVHYVFDIDEDAHATRGDGERFSNLTRQPRDEHQARAFKFLRIRQTLMQERFRHCRPSHPGRLRRGRSARSQQHAQVIALLSRSTPGNHDDLLRLHFNG
jgi:hypothetical protein